MSRGREYAIERIRHIVAACNSIGTYVKKGRQVFDSDSTVRDAILYQIIIIGEAAKAVVAADGAIEEEVPTVEWSLWAKMRDRITHQYWATDHEIVWLTATRDVSALRAELTKSLLRL